MWIGKRNVYRRPGILLVGLFLAMSGCALGHGAAGSPVKSTTDGRPVLLIVTNRYNSPMQVYARGSGATYQMGTVLPGLVGHFVVRQIMIASGPVEFVAQANNRQQPIQSEPLLLVPGDVVDFEIANSPINSIVTVRP